MKDRFIYEAVLRPTETGGHFAYFPDLPDAFTEGESIEEAIHNAAEVLELILAEHIDEGTALPKPTFGHRVAQEGMLVVISVALTDEMIRDTASVNSTEAAKLLGVGKSRVAQLAASGQLESYGEGTARRITLSSINARLKQDCKAGRPRKVSAA